MVFYYRFAGVNAITALIMNILILMGALAYFKAHLTLPGIAGIILTIGMAVDANVLVFERIREELSTGKSVLSAIASGFSRAFRTILDANVTTIIAAIFLFQFGTGPIKGFAITLIIGITASMFTALFVSRLIFDLPATRRRKQEKLSI
jgi:preprotein translocase subunit SecD